MTPGVRRKSHRAGAAPPGAPSLTGRGGSVYRSWDLLTTGGSCCSAGRRFVCVSAFFGMFHSVGGLSCLVFQSMFACC